MAEAHIKCDSLTSRVLLLSALLFKTAEDFSHKPVRWLYVLLLSKIKA